jgi:DNA polymerase-1
MLQLVTATDRQFVPAVGSGKEHYYDVDAVREEYGVVPDEVPVVRALSGDTSDTIPGAPGFGLKTASKLVKLYGSIDRIFASNLAGLTKTQYGNLRASEKQVRLNVDLMRLHCDLPLTLVGPSPDQIAAASRLRDVDIQPDPILAALFAERVSES